MKEKKQYYKEYHKRTYQKLLSPCSLCGIVEELGHKKYCVNCKNKIPNCCQDCGKEYVSKAKYKRCSTCQYHWYKINKPLQFTAAYAKAKARVNQALRTKKGLPMNHVFNKGPRGEGYVNKKGYRLMVMRHPSGKGYIRKYQHTIVMEKFLERSLKKGESVHHKNGDRLDNKIENLELWVKGQPAGSRVEDKIQWSIEFLREYGYSVQKND